MQKVSIREQDIVIPTYCAGKEEKNPMFFEKRVYQGSSGKVYPNPVIEKIADESSEMTYHAVVLENQYLYVIVLPELGGRIYTAYDKSNGYDFVYHNHVIKPALVGLLGPWISGGIEFNWPQHHRPSTFMHLRKRVIKYPDGSAGVFVGEIENMSGLQGVTEIKLYPDRAYIEINAQVYNRSDLIQTFLWWANPAYRVNDDTVTVMPPDVTAVMDHGKRAVSTFPIATGEYYKMDYSRGVDISRYKNIEVPTSFMAYRSNFDFVGGYDYGREAGLYHYADHHISPGKKQWTWGCGDFGRAWDRNLTDSDGPYVELMTGCFTDNQPDFTFIQPAEEKTFTQYFMPYQKVGGIKNANRDFCLNLENGELIIYSSGEFENVTITAQADGKTVLHEVRNFTPLTPYRAAVADSASICVRYAGKELCYSRDTVQNFPIPDPAVAIPEPEVVATTEELYLYGLHIEQYRHATRLAEDYYLEGLRRDATDYRLNNAYGLLLLRRGMFRQAEQYFETAIKKLTVKNPNPVTTEPYYNLGISLLYQSKYDEAYDRFYKCVWSNENKTGAFYYLAVIDSLRKETEKAVIHVSESITFNAHNTKSVNLLGRLLAEAGDARGAQEAFKRSQKVNKLDVLSAYELKKAAGTDCCAPLKELTFYEVTDLCWEYLLPHRYEEAEQFLLNYASCCKQVCPIVWYYLAYAQLKQGKDCTQSLRLAGASCDIIYFPARLSDIVVLQEILLKNSGDYLANYYLGNLFYDKKQYQLARDYWLQCEKQNALFPTVKRNLALYYYNKERSEALAVSYLEAAFGLDGEDSRVMTDLFQLYQITGKSKEFLFQFLKDHLPVAASRDDLYLEYVDLVADSGGYKSAEEMIAKRKFHPWEGGEGKVTKVYKKIKIGLYRAAKAEGDYERGIGKLTEGLHYPDNLGEGKLILDTDNDIHYYLGEAYGLCGNAERSAAHYELALRGSKKIADSLYYNDTPVEYLYYMALAYRATGKAHEAAVIKKELLSFIHLHRNQAAAIDYFAVSLPDMLVWEQDPYKRNNMFCDKLAALAEMI